MPSRPKSKRTASLPAVVKNDKQLATRPVILLVLGPHRSGTSLTARMLECLGAKNSKNQLPPQPDNPTGFFEDADVYYFGESVFLPKIQRRWDSVSPTDWSVLSKTESSRLGLQALEIIRRNYPLSSPLSILKEPRINNTLPFWLSLLEHAGFDVRFVCIVRDPVSAARSLKDRNNFSIAHSGMIYLAAWLSVLPHLQERQVAFVQFDEVFAMPGKILVKVADKLRLPLPEDFDQRVHAFTSEHLDPSLRHSSMPHEDVMLEPDLPPLVTELYSVLLDAAQTQNIRKTAKFVAHAEGQIESLAPLLADYDAKQIRLTSLQAESQAAQVECARLQAQLTDSNPQIHSALGSDHDELAARLASLESEHFGLVTRHSSLITAFEELQGKHTSLVTEREALRSTHSTLVAERDDLAARQAAMAETTAQLAATEQELQQLRAGAAQHEQQRGASVRLEELEHCLKDLTARHRKLVEERASLESEHSNLVTCHTLLVTEREALQSAHSSLSTLHSSLVAERNDLAARVSSLESDHSSLIAERNGLATTLDKVQAQHSPLIAELEHLRDEAAARQAVQSEMQAKLTTAEQALAEAQSTRENIEADAKDTAEENKLLLTQLHQVEEELEKYFLENRELKQQLDHLTSRLSSLESEHSSLSTLHSSLIAERNELATTLDELHSSLVTELESLRDETGARQAAQSELQAKLTTAEEALAEAQSTREKIEADAKDTAEENKLLLTQLQQVQGELEKYFLENRELKQQNDHLTVRISTLEAGHSKLATHNSSLVKALEDLQGQHSSLSARHSLLSTEREVLESDHFSLFTIHSSLVAERDNLEARLLALEAEKTTLTHALDSAQCVASRLEENVAIRYQELAILARELTSKDEALKDAEDKALYRGANGCQIASIELMDSVERSPHSHLNVLLRHLQVGPTIWPWVRIRLVEHHGRPGLVVFESPGEAVPLRHSTRSGEENGMHFFLLIPGDESGREFFLEAPSTDIYFVYFLVKSLESELHKAAHKSIHPVLSSDHLYAWAQLAASLRRLLEGESSRFRHGGSTAKAVSIEKNKESIKVDLRDCLYGGRFLPRISFTWGIATDSLNFKRGENPTLPFLEWPMARNGSAVGSVDVSFLRKPLKNQTFQQGPLGPHDAEFALALAQHLPSFLLNSPAQACLAKARKFVSRYRGAACVQLTERKN